MSVSYLFILLLKFTVL